MFCPNCGKQIGENVNFCSFCGNNLSKIGNAKKISSTNRKYFSRQSILITSIITVIIGLIIVVVLCFSVPRRGNLVKIVPDELLTYTIEGIKYTSAVTDLKIESQEKYHDGYKSKCMITFNDANIQRIEYCEMYVKKSGLTGWKVLDWEYYDNCEVSLHTGPEEKTISFDIGNKHFDKIDCEIVSSKYEFNNYLYGANVNLGEDGTYEALISGTLEIGSHDKKEINFYWSAYEVKLPEEYMHKLAEEEDEEAAKSIVADIYEWAQTEDVNSELNFVYFGFNEQEELNIYGSPLKEWNLSDSGNYTLWGIDSKENLTLSLSKYSIPEIATDFDKGKGIPVSWNVFIDKDYNVTVYQSTENDEKAYEVWHGKSIDGFGVAEGHYIANYMDMVGLELDIYDDEATMTLKYIGNDGGDTSNIETEVYNCEATWNENVLSLLVDGKVLNFTYSPLNDSLYLPPNSEFFGGDLLFYKDSAEW